MGVSSGSEALWLIGDNSSGGGSWNVIDCEYFSSRGSRPESRPANPTTSLPSSHSALCTSGMGEMSPWPGLGLRPGIYEHLCFENCQSQGDPQHTRVVHDAEV